MTTMTTAEQPIADGLFELIGGEPVLIGSRCSACATVAFPAQGSCPRCTSEAVQRHRLASTGTLWTWTTQGFRPKSPPYTGPKEFEPYAVGYVELGGEIRVEGILTETDPARLRIGMQMRTTLQPVLDAAGERRVTYAFAPAGAGAATAGGYAATAGGYAATTDGAAE